LRGTLGHSSKEIGESFERMIAVTTPATIAPTMSSTISFTSVLMSPTTAHVSAEPLGRVAGLRYYEGVTGQIELLL